MIFKERLNGKIHCTSNIVTEYEIHDHLPELISFEISEELAREIVGVASMLSELKSGTYTRLASGLAKCLRYDPNVSAEQAAADPNGNIMASDVQHLIISQNAFKLTALVNEWCFTVDTEWFTIKGLVQDFGLHPDLLSSPVREFTQAVARMHIWDYDKPDGTPYKECEEPSEGYVDSHCALMDTIEDARKALAIL